MIKTLAFFALCLSSSVLSIKLSLWTSDVESCPSRPLPEITCERLLGECYQTNTSVQASCWEDHVLCYEKAECKVQPDGKCGFTKTQELSTCLSRTINPPGTDTRTPSVSPTVLTPSVTNTTIVSSSEGLPSNTTVTFTGSSSGNCRPTGCYNSDCADHDMPSVCPYKPKYDCFKYSSCGSTQGICGWTHNADFYNCFENANGST